MVLFLGASSASSAVQLFLTKANLTAEVAEFTENGNGFFTMKSMKLMKGQAKPLFLALPLHSSVPSAVLHAQHGPWDQWV